MINERNSGKHDVQERRIVEDEIKKLKEEKQYLLSSIQEKECLLKKYKTWVPPGHYYSPIPDVHEIRQRENNIFNDSFNKIDGLDLNEEEQVELYGKLQEFYNELPFLGSKKEDLRYYFENDFFLYTDAIILYSMMRYLKPRRIIEIGSGYSSCVMLDINERFFNNSILCTFIEPDPQRLFSLIEESDKNNINLRQSNLQDIDEEIFLDLSEGDILFIDSTHVSKTNSDVNLIFSKILPNLKKGVYIHFHDIFYPFEYPKEWVYQGRAWNEAYILKAFLQYNDNFKIKFFNSFFGKFYSDKLAKYTPLCLKNTGGSIWIQKVK